MLSHTHIQMTVNAENVKLAGLLKTLDPSISSYDLEQVQDDIEGEREALPDAEDSSQVSDVLTIVNKVSTAVKEETEVEYKQ